MRCRSETKVNRGVRHRPPVPSISPLLGTKNGFAGSPMRSWPALLDARIAVHLAESLLSGLVAAARARGVDHDEEMAKVVDDFADVATLEHVVQRVPPELEGVSDSQLGDPTLMTPTRLREWLYELTR